MKVAFNSLNITFSVYGLLVASRTLVNWIYNGLIINMFDQILESLVGSKDNESFLAFIICLVSFLIVIGCIVSVNLVIFKKIRTKLLTVTYFIICALFIVIYILLQNMIYLVSSILFFIMVLCVLFTRKYMLQ